MPKTMTLLINLDGSDERLASATHQLKAASLAFRRHPAFDGRGRNAVDFPEYDAKKAVRFYGRPMTGGEMGCYFSHIDCAEAFLNSDADFGLILEDDVLFKPDSFEVLNNILQEIEASGPKDWDMINLCMAPSKMYRIVNSVTSETGTHDLARAFYSPMTTTAILWSRGGAKRFLATRQHIYAPFDHFLRRWLTLSGRGLAVVPPLFGVTGADSDLDDEGGGTPARRRVARTPAYFWAEFKRQSVNYAAAIYHLTRQKFKRS